MSDRYGLSRLPMRFWVQLAVGLVVLGALAAFGFVLLLAGMVVVFGLAVALQILAWFKGQPSQSATSSVIEGEYSVIDRSNEHGDQRKRHRH